MNDSKSHSHLLFMGMMIFDFDIKKIKKEKLFVELHLILITSSIQAWTYELICKKPAWMEG